MMEPLRTSRADDTTLSNVQDTACCYKTNRPERVHMIQDDT